MEPDPQVTSLCGEIAEEVRDIAINLFMGRLSPPVFEKAVVTLEAAKLKRFGFHLATERLSGGGSRFTLISDRTDHPCATLDFNAATEVLEVHHTCG